MGKVVEDLTGISGNSLQIGLTGPQLTAIGNDLAGRNAADSAYAIVRALMFATYGNDFELNSGAAGSGADWKMTLRRPSTGMTHNLTVVMPAADPAVDQALTVASFSGGVITLQWATGVSPAYLSAFAQSHFGVLSILDFIPSGEWAAIANGTSTYDCLAAMNNALAVYGMPPGVTETYSAAGPDIYMPPGLYNFSNHVNIKRRVRIFGADSSGAYGSEATWLVFANSGGFIVHNGITMDYTTVSPGYSGSGSIIERLNLHGGNSSVDGILLRSVAVVRDCRIDSFHGDGIKVIATAGAGGANEGSANSFVVERCQSYNNFGNGFSAKGADANAGVFRDCRASGNSACGFRDDSFLGNKYDSCLAEANGVRGQVTYGGNHYAVLNDTTGGTTTPGTDPTVWEDMGPGIVDYLRPAYVPNASYVLGRPYVMSSIDAYNARLDNAYMEQDQAPPMIAAPALVLGGNLLWTYASTGSYLFGQPRGVGCYTGLTTYSIDGQLVVAVGARPDNNDILAITDATYAPLTWRFRRKRTDFVFDYADLDDAEGFRVTGPTSGAQYGRTGATPYAFQADRLFIGTGPGNGRQLTNGYTPPASGEWGVGDICFNLNAANPAGWMCTVAGTPGTWAALPGLVTTAAQTFTGVKTFSSSPIVPDPTNPTDAVNLETLQTYASAADIRNSWLLG